MSALGQSRHFAAPIVMSVLLLKADLRRRFQEAIANLAPNEVRFFDLQLEIER
jgi:hypothetical protein